jgi:hypothetical protein
VVCIKITKDYLNIQTRVKERAVYMDLTQDYMDDWFPGTDRNKLFRQKKEKKNMKNLSEVAFTHFCITVY